MAESLWLKPSLALTAQEEAVTAQHAPTLEPDELRAASQDAARPHRAVSQGGADAGAVTGDTRPHAAPWLQQPGVRKMGGTAPGGGRHHPALDVGCVGITPDVVGRGVEPLAVVDSARRGIESAMGDSARRRDRHLPHGPGHRHDDSNREEHTPAPMLCPPVHLLDLHCK